MPHGPPSSAARAVSRAPAPPDPTKEHDGAMNPSDSLLHRGLRLEYATLGWNVVGSLVVIGAALSARSVALAGFGLDSLIETFASLVVIWQLTGVDGRERRALRLIGGAF